MKRLSFIPALLVFGLMSCWGLRWGLYNDVRAAALFPATSSWSAERAATVLADLWKDQPTQGADVDPDPQQTDGAVLLNGSSADIAQIYARFLLYSNQPDEMITFRALSRIKPSAWAFDPGLYQYGGMFIYPIGAMVQLSSWCGWIPIGSMSDFLQSPEIFARVYVLGRIYVVLWGCVGMWVIWQLGRTLDSERAGLTAAILCALSPVVVCLAHESKPHLPGVVLSLVAVWMALRYYADGRRRDQMCMSIACGLALGMVLSSVSVLVVIPAVELLRAQSWRSRIFRALSSACVAMLSYAITNPYVLINLISMQPQLMSNISNSQAMYSVSDLGSGLITAIRLLAAGSSSVALVCGATGVLLFCNRRQAKTLCIVALPAVCSFVQFWLLAHDKPPEYARFGLMSNVVLCIFGGLALARLRHPLSWTVCTLMVLTTVAMPTLGYLSDYTIDGTTRSHRMRVASALAPGTPIAVLRDPAPYNFPPVEFSTTPVVLLPADVSNWPSERQHWPDTLVMPYDAIENVNLDDVLEDGHYRLPGPPPRDDSPISWANKPLLTLHAHGSQQ